MLNITVIAVPEKIEFLLIIIRIKTTRETCTRCAACKKLFPPLVRLSPRGGGSELALATRRTPARDKNRPDAIKRAQSSNPWSFTVIISERVHSRGHVRACKIAVPRHASPLPFNWINPPRLGIYVYIRRSVVRASLSPLLSSPSR